MSEATPVIVTPPVTKEATIHDAIDALFASKETAAPAVVAPAVTTEATEVPVVEGEPTPAVEAAPEPVVEPAKVSAADYAIQLARAKKKLAAAKATAPTPVMPSADAIKRAAAIEAAGGDPLKAFEAAGLDLAAVVQAFENRRATDPEYPDPLAKEVKALGEKLALYERREKDAVNAKATDNFIAIARERLKDDAFEYVRAYGEEGLALVTELVLEEAANGRNLPLNKALQMAEDHYSEKAEIAAKTKKLAKKFTPQTRKPGIGSQAPIAGAAPITQTRPKTVDDVINSELDALLG